MTRQQVKRIARYLFGGAFIIAGINHFVMTSFYVSIVPPYLPWPLALVIISGLAEIGLGALLLFQRWSVLAAWGSGQTHLNCRGARVR